MSPRRACVIAVTFAISMLVTAAPASFATSLTLWNLNTDVPTREWYQSVFKAAFEEEFPGVTLEFSFPGTSEFYDKFLVAVAAGTSPDVVTSNNALFLVEGLVEDLTPYISRWAQAESFPPSLLHVASYQGRIYGLPVTLAPRTLVVNKRLLAESGYDPDRPPTTWDEIGEAVPRLTRWDADRTTIVQAGLQLDQTEWAWQGFMYTNGVDVVNDDETAGFANAKGVETLEFWGNLYREYAPVGVALPPFARGDTALYPYANPAVFTNIARSNPDALADIAVAPLPVNRERAATLIFAAPIGISAYAKDKELAWELLAFHFRPDLLQQHNERRGFIPPTREALTQEMIEQSPWFEDYLRLVSEYGVPAFAFTSTKLQFVRGFFAEAMQKYHRSEGSARVLLEEAARQWNAVVTSD